MDYQKELELIESQVETQKIEKVKLSERKRQLTEEKSKILKELKDLGINENEIEEIIEDLEVKLQKGITSCKQILN